MSAKTNLSKVKPDWNEAQERFDAWWRRSKMGRPAMSVTVKRDTPIGELEPIPPPRSDEDIHIGVDRKIALARNMLKSYDFLAEAFPAINLNIGPGSIATYLGAPPVFSPDTVWYEHTIKDYDEFGELRFDSQNHWWLTHIERLKEACEKIEGQCYVTIPDLVENLDILSAMRGPQELCFDLIDHPEIVRRYVDQIDDLYFNYYDPIYDLVQDQQGGSAYTAFQIWGAGKTAKVQCDFSALMSPSQFEDFVVPSLKKQCAKLDFSLYHLDGPDAIRHVDALMKIDELDALQWTAGAGQTPSQDERWDPIRDKVKKAGKSLWVAITDTDDFTKMIDDAERIVKKYGPEGLYLLFPEMSESQGRELIRIAERRWN